MNPSSPPIGKIEQNDAETESLEKSLCVYVNTCYRSAFFTYSREDLFLYMHMTHNHYFIVTFN